MHDSCTELTAIRATPGTSGKCRIPGRVGGTSRVIPSVCILCI